MLYIEDKKFKRQLSLIEFMSSLYELELVIWMYPESNLDTFLDWKFDVSDTSDAEPVTSYESGVMAKRTSRIDVTSEVIDRIRSEKTMIKKNCDSLCVYSKGSFNWLACTVGHEGMSLVRDDDLYNKVKNKGFNVSFDPPEWW